MHSMHRLAFSQAVGQLQSQDTPDQEAKTVEGGAKLREYVLIRLDAQAQFRSPNSPGIPDSEVALDQLSQMLQSLHVEVKQAISKQSTLRSERSDI
jgi:hypothetical protein